MSLHNIKLASALSIALLFLTCHRNNPSANNFNAMRQDCYKTRKVERAVIEMPGEIQFMLDKYFIFGEGNQRYEPCDVPMSFRKIGLKVIFSGEIMTINPEERRAGIPLHLNAISKAEE